MPLDEEALRPCDYLLLQGTTLLYGTIALRVLAIDPALKDELAKWLDPLLTLLHLQAARCRRLGLGVGQATATTELVYSWVQGHEDELDINLPGGIDNAATALDEVRRHLNNIIEGPIAPPNVRTSSYLKLLVSVTTGLFERYRAEIGRPPRPVRT